MDIKGSKLRTPRITFSFVDARPDQNFSGTRGKSGENGIPRGGNPAITIKYYKNQFHEHIIINVMWYVFYLLDPHNK